MYKVQLNSSVSATKDTAIYYKPYDSFIICNSVWMTLLLTLLVTACGGKSHTITCSTPAVGVLWVRDESMCKVPRNNSMNTNKEYP